MDIYYYSVLVPSCLTIFVAITSIIMYFRNVFNDVETKFQLIISQCIDLALGLFTIIKIPGNDPWCKTQAYFIQTFYFFSVFWSSVVIYQVFYEFRNEKLKPFKIKKMVFPCFACSVIISLIPIATNSFGEDIAFCFYDTDKDPWFMVLICYYVPFWIFSFFTMFLLYKIQKIIEFRLKDLGDQIVFINTLRFFPISLMVCYLPLNITRVIEISEYSESKVEWFFAFSLAFSRLHAVSTSGFLFYAYRMQISFRKKFSHSSKALDEVARALINGI